MSVTIPPGTAAGIYYVIARADAASAVPETQEANNPKLSAPVKIGPDLIVSAMTAPASALAASTITVTDTTRNTGAGDAPASTTYYYLSSNVLLDAADTRVGSRSVGALASGASDTGPATITIPAGITAATYFLIAAADGPAAVAETSDTNNTRFVAVKIQ